MKYYSLNHQSPEVDFREAVLKGQAPDGGLYFPRETVKIDAGIIQHPEQYSNAEIAFRIMRPYVGDTIPEELLYRIVEETTSFPVPLVSINKQIATLELFHGPTLAFKDTGARFMSRCLGYFAREKSEKITVLAATSGDTGGAVADGFYDVEGIDVVILYPSGKVSPVQEKQLTTHGKNIYALEVNGSFDDCQQMVKQAFADVALNGKMFLTSANSINVARWLSQQVYYLLAWKQWPDKDHPPVISVPSGNFGNICAGLMAHVSGMPVTHFIAACNANDVIPAYMRTGAYVAKKAVATLSNAMDIGHPSNFIRVLEIFRNKFESVKEKITAYSITDEETVTTMQQVYETTHYVLDPHGAVGYLALQRYLQTRPGENGLFIETAHPVKFIETVQDALGIAPPIPAPVQELLAKEKHSTITEPQYEALKAFLLQLA
jgi:threonine synthase